VIEEKIIRYKQELTLAKELSKRKYADRDYYSELVNKFEKILKFYEDLKLWREITES
jgi:hypothetical protein